MNKSLPFFNWSLQKALSTESDGLVRARIRIIYTLLLFSLLKAFVVIFLGAEAGQWKQVVRAAAGLVFYVLMIKALLSFPSRLKLISHLLLIGGAAVIWSSVFFYAHGVNLAIVQFVFMLVLTSFYIVGSRAGIAYSIVGIFPILITLVMHGNVNVLGNDPEKLASPAVEIVIVLNFISIILAHYLFYRAFHENIREKETLNQQLQLSVAEANKLAASKSGFLSTMSHELRTPLNSVVGITELMLRENPDERHKDNLKILQFSTRDLLSLINNVLDFNKIDSGKLELEAVPFCLAEFMNDICAGLRIKANDKQLDFRLEIDKQLEDIHIISDPTRLSQLVYNLAGNAIKFTHKGNITVKLACVKQTAHHIDVLFSVADTGIGIEPENHEVIFEMFTQAGTHITRNFGGTGLGLSIVKQILNLFESSIQLESSPGKGTRFFFTISFPITGTKTEEKKAITAHQTNFSHLKILVAEDNEINRLIVKKQLSKMNVEPVMVENGKLAYEACLSDNFDAVFMDLHMPEWDGYATTKQIRALDNAAKANTYIIAFTASVTEQQQIFENGFDDYLYKPVNMESLRIKLEKIAGRVLV